NQANNAVSIVSLVKLPVDLVLAAPSMPDPISVGQDVSYTYLLSNKGPNQATSVVFVDELAPSLQFISATASAGACGFANGLVTCLLPDLPPGSGVTVAIS